MAERTPALRDRLTPNQLDKQRQIVEAARRVLAAAGLAGCTAREVAAASGLSKSAIHYYFADITVLIDRAMGEHVTAFEADLRAAAAAPADPAERFWRTVEAYLATFREQPHVTQLWFEYWIDASRTDRLAAVSRMHQQIVDVFAERLEALQVPGAAVTARAVFTYLLGAIIEQSIHAPGLERVRAQVATIAGLPER